MGSRGPEDDENLALYQVSVSNPASIDLPEDDLSHLIPQDAYIYKGVQEPENVYDVEYIDALKKCKEDSIKVDKELREVEDAADTVPEVSEQDVEPVDVPTAGAVSPSDQTQKILLSSLPEGWTDTEFGHLVRAHGTVLRCQPMKKNKVLYTLSSPAEAANAVRCLNNVLLNGRTIKAEIDNYVPQWERNKKKLLYVRITKDPEETYKKTTSPRKTQSAAATTGNVKSLAEHRKSSTTIPPEVKLLEKELAGENLLKSLTHFASGAKTTEEVAAIGGVLVLAGSASVDVRPLPSNVLPSSKDIQEVGALPLKQADLLQTESVAGRSRQQLETRPDYIEERIRRQEANTREIYHQASDRLGGYGAAGSYGPAAGYGAAGQGLLTTAVAHPGLATEEQTLQDHPDQDAAREAHASKIRLVLPCNRIGSMIGRHGDNIKRIKAESHVASIRALPDPLPWYDQVVEIEGAFSSCRHALRRILERDLLSEFGPDTRGHEAIELRTLVPDMFCGLLIGKEGSAIKSIKDNTGTHITVSKLLHLMEVYPDRIMTFRGQLPSVLRAEAMVRDKLEQLYEANQASDSGRYGQRRYIPVDNPEHITYFIEIKDQFAGRLIGNYGINIKKMMRETRAYITVIPRTTENTQNYRNTKRQVSITGNLDAIFRASFWVFDQLSRSVKNKNAFTYYAISSFTIPHNMVGRVIGRKGVKVRQIQQANNVTITIGHNPDLVNSEMYHHDGKSVLVELNGCLIGSQKALNSIHDVLDYGFRRDGNFHSYSEEFLTHHQDLDQRSNPRTGGQPFRSANQSASSQWDRRNSNQERGAVGGSGGGGVSNPPRERGASYDGPGVGYFDRGGYGSRRNSNSVYLRDPTAPAIHTPASTVNPALPAARDSAPLPARNSSKQTTPKSRLSSSAAPFEPATLSSELPSLAALTRAAVMENNDKGSGDVFVSAESNSSSSAKLQQQQQQSSALKLDAAPTAAAISGGLHAVSADLIRQVNTTDLTHGETAVTSPVEPKDATFEENVTAAKGIKDSLLTGFSASVTSSTTDVNESLPGASTTAASVTATALGKNDPPHSAKANVATTTNTRKLSEALLTKELIPSSQPEGDEASASQQQAVSRVALRVDCEGFKSVDEMIDAGKQCAMGLYSEAAAAAAAASAPLGSAPHVKDLKQIAAMFSESKVPSAPTEVAGVLEPLASDDK